MAGVLGEPPFVIDVDVRDTTAATEVCIEFCGAKRDSTLDSWRETLSYFVSAAAAGTFCGERSAPTDSVMRILEVGPANAGGLQYRCMLQGVDPSAFRILLNLAVQSHFVHEALERLSVRVPAGTEPRLGFDGIRRRPFPGRWARSGFSLRLGESLSETTEPLVRVEFERALDPDEFERVSQSIADWDSIVLIGGYCESLDELDDFPMIPGDTALITPTTLEHAMHGFEAPLVSFDGLINLAANWHARLCRVAWMELE